MIKFNRQHYHNHYNVPHSENDLICILATQSQFHFNHFFPFFFGSFSLEKHAPIKMMSPSVGCTFYQCYTPFFQNPIDCTTLPLVSTWVSYSGSLYKHSTLSVFSACHRYDSHRLHFLRVIRMLWLSGCGTLLATAVAPETCHSPGCSLLRPLCPSP